jgi:hypothetical protein
MAFLWVIVGFPSSFVQAEAVKGVYFGSNAYGAGERIRSIAQLLTDTEVNTVVIDLKDDRGIVISDEEFEKVVRPFRDAGAKIMCRIVALKDNRHTALNPHLALKSRSTGGLWRDNDRNAFLDPALPETAQYLIELAERAIKNNCEPNFDYIRFPSDGKLKDILLVVSHAPKEKYPYLRKTMRGFLASLSAGIKEKYPQALYSADIFGYAAMDGEPGIGQYVEDFVEFGFGVFGMFYPSHYKCNAFGILDPNTDPFLVLYKSLAAQIRYLKKKGYATARITPWIQGFDIKNIYGCGKKVEYANDPARFRQQIRALLDIRTEKEFQSFGLEDSWIVWHSGAYYNPQNFNPKRK